MIEYGEDKAAYRAI